MELLRNFFFFLSKTKKNEDDIGFKKKLFVVLLKLGQCIIYVMKFLFLSPDNCN